MKKSFAFKQMSGEEIAYWFSKGYRTGGELSLRKWLRLQSIIKKNQSSRIYIKFKKFEDSQAYKYKNYQGA